EPHVPAAYIEHPGDGPVRGVVQGDVGVEHQDGDETHLRLPDHRLHHAPGHVDGAGEDAGGRGLGGEQGPPGEVVMGVDVLLEAVRVRRLPEVARAVEQAHTHQGDAEV